MLLQRFTIFRYHFHSVKTPRAKILKFTLKFKSKSIADTKSMLNIEIQVET